MHSLPTSASPSTCIVLKHKLPTHLKRKRPVSTGTTPALAAKGLNLAVGSNDASASNVDQDLLATVLRVHLEAKLRRSRLRSSATTLRTRVLQRAVNSLEDAPVATQLTTSKAQFGFQDALVQLSHLKY